jgi:hypothetical protein
VEAEPDDESFRERGEAGLLRFFQFQHERMPYMPKSKSAPREAKVEPQGYKLKPAARYIGGLSVPTMHRLIQRGLLRPNRSLRHIIFSRAELDRFLKDGIT